MPAPGAGLALHARPFGTLLVANRGEIALRIIRTAHAMSLRTVAVYSDADREAEFVRAASAAVHIGPTPAAESYLSVEAILDAAARSGAEAVHPGYGFLSERAELSRAVTEAGLVFVGPPADVMEVMGRKDAAREVAIAAGVPVVPRGDDLGVPGFGDGVAGEGRAGVPGFGDGVAGEGRAGVPGFGDRVAREGRAGVPGFGDRVAREGRAGVSRFPVLVKAAAGGGGKGMRIVRSADEYDEAVASAKREALAAFGDDTILVEQYVERGRHIEVQVLADTHGAVVHLFERDCSTQRRHQKVLEEAPAPTITDEVRRLVTESSVALAREVGYVNAGTVEFLLDNATGEPYFLEMNTRLQVEHPVTEATVRIAGQPLDLVEQQLRVAMGERLPVAQGDITVSGHAIEARIYAEDAFNGFLPQAGRAEVVRWSDRARNDVGLFSGQVVSSAYDPMIGKVIVHGPDREAARSKLVAALDDTAIIGLTTNVGFVRGLLSTEAFRRAEIDTAWLDRNPDAVVPVGQREAAVFAAWAIADYELEAEPGHPFGTGDGWRLSGPAAPASISLVVDGEETLWSVSWRRVVGPDGAITTRLISREVGRLRLEIDGRIRSAAVLVTAREVVVVHRGNTFRFGRPDPFAAGAAVAAAGTITAPMPGTVLDVRVEKGAVVEAGEPLGVIEAMKMELTLKAPFAGTVTDVDVAAGQQVALGARLFVVEEDEA